LADATGAAGFQGSQAATGTPPGGSAVGLPAAGPPGPRAGAWWLDELRARDSVRRAIVAREILGPPVALR
jgi:hypothetical protein